MTGMSIHQRIRDGRIKLGLNEYEFAARLGVTRAAVQQWEKEGGTAPKRQRLKAVADLLGISEAELVSGEADPMSEPAPRMSVHARMLAQSLDAISAEQSRFQAFAAAMNVIARYSPGRMTQPTAKRPTPVPAKKPLAKH